MLFQSRIAEAIKMSDFTQKELAKKLNISESNITNWKKGDNLPSLVMLFNICKILNVTSDYLLGLEDEIGNKVNVSNSFNNNSGNINFKS